tara:strand:+ start:26799 stop:27182 length:384 start_codon:yes stop_codon:yes gene_type:complete
MGKYEVINDLILIGLIEETRLYFGKNKKKKVMSKIDTGATKSSIDARLAEELKLGPVIKTRVVKSAHGNMRRPVIEVEIELAGKILKSEFTIADRSHLKFKILIGQNILKQGFLIDPNHERSSSIFG